MNEWIGSWIERDGRDGWIGSWMKRDGIDG